MIEPRIIWLASYPKSGNTWFRAFLANFWRNSDEPVDINNLGGGPIASARKVFDDEVGVEASDLTFDEIERYRPRVYEQVAAECQETIFLKIHDAFTYNSWEEPVISKAATLGAIYFIRNPLDVAVSFAHHSAAPVEIMIKQMANPNNSMVGSPKHLSNQLRQRLLTWSGHVTSWVDEPDLPVHVMRYEDMKRDTFDTFRGAVQFAGLPDDAARIQKALDNASFGKLQAQEKEKGFGEKMPFAKSFFRKGEIGSWREVLTPEQIERIINDHGEVMGRFGYLTETGEIV